MKYLLLILLMILTGCEKPVEPEVYEDELLERENYIDGKLEDSVLESYYSNGQLLSKGNYKDGKESGLWELYHKNGQLWEKGNYVDGKKDGLFKSYSEEGAENPWSPQCWQNDKKVDLSICKQ